MDATARRRAAGLHITSAAVAMVSLALGGRWVAAGGEPPAIPVIIIVLSLVILTPLAVHRSAVDRGRFIDDHVEAACRLLTRVGMAGALVIGAPILVAWAVPSGPGLGLIALSSIGAVALPVTWAWLAGRAAAGALQGRQALDSGRYFAAAIRPAQQI
jgi:class 3 adenylate cyclase